MHDEQNSIYPLIPLRNMVIFPRMIIPLFIGRERSLDALSNALDNEKLIVLASQRDEGVEEPGPDLIYEIGTMAEIVQVLKLPDETTKVLVEGLGRVRIKRFSQSDPSYLVEAEKLEDTEKGSNELEVLSNILIEQFESYVKLNKKIPAETLMSIVNIEEPGRLADLIASYLILKVAEKQEILELQSVLERCKKLNEILLREIDLLEVEKKLHVKVKDQIDKVQREYYLKEKIKAIQDELGGEEGGVSPEVAEYRARIASAQMSEEARKKADKELSRLAKMPGVTAESGVIRTYLDWLIDLPWYKKTKETLRIAEVERILNEDHHGLEKVKERVLEYFSVFKLTHKIQGSILCFAGPPGVGKTSIARSIARSMHREFYRISLGGMRDEAELRGHRRTYVGSMPGRIIQALQKVAYKNPVILLDEIDKMASDFRGDPAAALMEILDPEQNKSFSDHYMEVAFDLSDILFICTANTLHNIPGPLLDRMELIDIPGYTEEEKIQIALRYLVPKQLEKHGLSKKSSIFPEEILRSIIKEYTKEAGVRNLERLIAQICRKEAKLVVEEKKTKLKMNKSMLRKFLGIPKFLQDKMEEADQPGVATGLAWTEMGGCTLPVEVAILKGRGNLTITGQLGEVMQESAKAALSYVRSKAEELHINPNFYRLNDIHIHVPEGAIPKDGPSAGITMATALASALSGIPTRKDVAMTGEITLRGRVLPIGGLKEKALAAFATGIRTVIIPDENQKDLEDIPLKIRKKIKFVPVRHMDQVLAEALIHDAPKIDPKEPLALA
ncbi:MAG: endopeptidase La [Candidatus Margulisiibacteriota bacterium]|jgi:ATP-dependent Lon protease